MAVKKKTHLLAEERRRKTLELIERNGQITLEELVRGFRISAVTARGDLDALAAMSTIVRSHGGGIRRHEVAQDVPLRLKAALQHKEKLRIALEAAGRVRPNETVILDSGTTTAEVARQLKALKVHPLTVITNALNIATELAEAPGITLLMIGGMLRPVSYSFVGPHAEAMLRTMHADRLFLGVDGIDPEHGPSTPDIFEAQLNSVMMRVAREVTVVADSTKLGRRSVSRIGPIEDVHSLITDSRAPAEMIAALVKRGVAVSAV
jgi:DeoR family transcriptional regulator of aga operon